MKITAISDLHGNLPTIDQSDILIISGDISPLNIQRSKPQMKMWLETIFLYWINTLPVDKVFLIAGNHDFYFENIPYNHLLELIILSKGKLIYLENEHVDYFDNDGIKWKIFGTPYCNIYGGWPFMKTEEYMTEKFKKIPDDVDIIISHSPPYGIGEVDTILESFEYNKPIDHLGNKPLRNRLDEINYKLLVCGHIHSGSHIPFNYRGGMCVNVSISDENCEPIYKPFYYEL